MRTVLARLLAVLVATVCVGPLGLMVPTTAAAADYEIGPGDVLKLSVAGQAELTANFTVDAEGMVMLPILGKIKAAELTPPELERKLTTLLADGYLKRPQVTVSVAEFGSQKVFVTGMVQRPGQYALKADRSLLQLLGDIGPLLPDVGHEVFVIRPPVGGTAGAGNAAGAAGVGSAAGATGQGNAPPGAPSALGPEFPAEANPPEAGTTPAAHGDKTPGGASPGTVATGANVGGTNAAGTNAAGGKPAPLSIPGLPFIAPNAEIFRISLLELQSGNPEKNISLRAGDTVYFPKASQVYVMGSVARPGPYRFQEGMTVLQALTLAGGATERGSAGRTKVVRIVNGQKVERKVKATDLVEPEDTLFVPERFF